MFPLQNVKLFNFYRRYKWNQDDFGILQDTLKGFPATVIAKTFGDAIINGLEQNGFASLNVSFLAGYAVNSLGNLLYSAAGSVAVANNVNSLVVIRPVNADTNSITRPTAPFDPVFLNTEQTAQVVAITGTLGVYPAKVAGDVILFGAVASGGVVTLIDQSQCELVGKYSEFINLSPHNILVGNHRECHYRTLAEAIAVAVSGDRIRVRSSESLAVTVTISQDNINVEFEPGVTFSAGVATIGFAISGDGVRFLNGRVTGFTTGINITGDYNTVMGTRFASNTTDVTDGPATSQQVGVISE